MFEAFNAVFESLMSGLPHLMAQSATAFGILGGGLYVYTWITPHDELPLIREGNMAAALSFGGAIVGLALPLAFCLASSVSVADVLVWGVLILILQLAAFFIVNLFLRNLSKRIEQGEMGSAVLLVSVQLSIAFINAAAISG